MHSVFHSIFGALHIYRQYLNISRCVTAFCATKSTGIQTETVTTQSSSEGVSEWLKC